MIEFVPRLFDKWHSRENVLICSVKNYSDFKKKYPKRYISPVIYCMDSCFYYYNKHSKLRTVMIETGQVYSWNDGSIVRLR